VSNASGDLQNVTLSVSGDLLREARHLAVDRGLSLSRFLAHTLEAEVEANRRARAARWAHLELLQRGWDLGTGGRATWSRDELHER